MILNDIYNIDDDDGDDDNVCIKSGICLCEKKEGRKEGERKEINWNKIEIENQNKLKKKKQRKRKKLATNFKFR